MKKILFFIPTLGGGGAEKVLVNLVNNLDRNDFDITVQTLFDVGINKKNLKPYIKYKYVFKRIFPGNIHFLKLFPKEYLYKKMVREDYDVVVSYLEGPTTRIVAGCDNKKTKIINWVHTEMNTISEFSSSYRSLKEMKETYKKYDMTIFVAKTTLENFHKYMNLKLKNEKVIRNIVETKEIERKAQKEMYKNKELTLVTLARLAKSKGYDRLLKIHKKLLEEGIKHKVWILGEGPEREKIEKYIKENNLKETVKLWGYQENPYKFINKADIYVCSSYIEGYSTAVTEAIIVGKPIVTTRCSGMNEILENGKYGMIVENNEKALYEGIKKMLINTELRKKYENLSTKRKEYFNIGNQLKQVADILNN